MDFITYISQSGCAVKCFFDETYLSNNSHLQLITSTNMKLQPESLDLNSSLLISTLIAKFLKFVIDPFSYNQETGKNSISINNKNYDIVLPSHLNELFNSNQSENRDTLQEKVYEEILKLITDDEHLKLFEILKKIDSPTDIITVIRNKKKVVIGVGKIFHTN
jgi:hypothetical protein